MERILEAARAFAREAMSGNDVAHDFLHVTRVASLAREICAATAGADPFVTELAALLHDVEDDKEPSAGRFRVEDFLRGAEIPGEQAERVAEIVRHISFRRFPRLPEDFPLEGKIVQDADRLDAMGAMGVARTFAYSGARGIPFYDPLGGRETTLAHFEDKLLRLAPLLNTEAARRMAARRQRVLADFYAQFLEEAGIHGG